MKNINWNDLHIFFHVADGGGLSAASRMLGMSVATVGRRMLSLEETVGQPLFVRSQSGYKLTKAGDTLLSKMRPMKSAARPLENWLSPERMRPLVRISAGTGTAAFLADNFAQLWNTNDAFKLAFVTAEARLDIGHREVEIGIRNKPEESGNLASKKLEKIQYAPFKNRHRPWPDQPEWVAVDAQNANHHSARWVLAQTDLPVCAWANSISTLYRLVGSGAGIGVMPCFVGDRDPVLKRAGPVIDALTETQWLVMHGDDRHRSEVRAVSGRIVELMRAHAPLLDGKRPFAE